MEAVAKYDFTATDVDELSFTKGTVIKILNDREDENWYRCEVDGKEGLVPRNYISVKSHDWYFSVTREEAEKMLKQQEGGLDKYPEGAFILRPSESCPEQFSLSVKYKESVEHFKILQDANGKYFIWVIKFNSINELIEHHKYSSISRAHVLILKDCIKQDNQQHDKQHPQQHQHQQGPACVYAQALFDFRAESEGDLELVRGDRIVVLDRSEKNWWKGQKDNKCGMFPASYVSLQ